jgi:NTE family protein
MSHGLAVSVALVLHSPRLRANGNFTTVKATGKPSTIGLVLSSGGARGWAHIGVLRWFEEHHVPVD